MKLSKERKIYVLILALAVAGIVIDRVISGSDLTFPERIHAGEVETPHDEITVPSPLDVVTDSSLADHFQGICEAEGIDFDNLEDVFPARSTQEESHDQSAASNHRSSLQDRIEAFKREHALTAGERSWTVSVS